MTNLDTVSEALPRTPMASQTIYKMLPETDNRQVSRPATTAIVSTLNQTCKHFKIRIINRFVSYLLSGLKTSLD